MCGFTGFTNYIKDDGTVLGRMMDRIVHRGPDASGQFVDTNIALGFRRLSIIDLAEGGQPMFNEDKSLVLVFNGEIYNFKELRAELLEKGHVFANNSDSEVLLHDKHRPPFTGVLDWEKIADYAAKAPLQLPADFEVGIYGSTPEEEMEGLRDCREKAERFYRMVQQRREA